jgi:hypothetical protein
MVVTLQPYSDFYLFSFSFSGWTLGEGIVVHDQNDDNVDVEKISVVEGMIKSDLTGGSTAQARKLQMNYYACKMRALKP